MPARPKVTLRSGEPRILNSVYRALHALVKPLKPKRRLFRAWTMCQNDAFEEVQEFRLTERFTFLEYLPVKKMSRSVSAPDICHCPTTKKLQSQESMSTDGEASSASSFGRQDSATSEDTDTVLELCEGREVPRWSVGSTLHSQGTCKPCAWFWRPGSCTRGADCRHCHLCAPGSLQRRKRHNRDLAKAIRRGRVASIPHLVVFTMPS